MPRPCYQKDGYIIVENKHKKGNYYTVVNTNLYYKPHSHLKTFKQAKLVIHWCIKERIPNRYTHHMKGSIRRLRPDIDFDKIPEVDNNNQDIIEEVEVQEEDIE